MSDLRDYQLRIVDELRTGWLQGHTRQVVGLATGGGKTEIAGALAASVAAKGRKLWFIVERTPLIEQTVKSFGRRGLNVGILWADRSNQLADEDCVVASIQTLASRWRRYGFLPPDIGAIVIDEVHMFHEAHRKLMRALPDVPVIGLSATPLREGLADHFTRLIRGPSVREMIDRKYLVDFRCFGPSIPDLSKVAIRRGDFAVGELSAEMRQRTILGDVVSTWRRLGEDRQTICFAVDRAHSRALTEEFQSEGVAAAHLDYRTSLDERTELFDAFRSRDLRVLISVGVLALGFDVPDVSCVILARPTMSQALHIQQCGRGARLADAKSDCLIMDHAGNCVRHGLPQDYEMPEGLLAGGSKSGATIRERDASPKPCPVCDFLVSPGSQVCPNCGAVRLPIAKVETLDAKLVELSGDRNPEDWNEDEKRQFYSELMRLGMDRANKPAAARYRYVDRFGEEPPNDTLPATAVSPTTLRWVERSQKAYFARKRGGEKSIPISNRVAQAERDRKHTRCPRCGGVHLPTIRPKGQHVGAFCPECNRWFGWIKANRRSEMAE